MPCRPQLERAELGGSVEEALVVEPPVIAAPSNRVLRIVEEGLP